jgi:ADP-ribose pyrophosphatase
VSDHITILDHRVVFEGRVFDVHRDRVRLPDGKNAVFDVVRHPGSVVLLPMPDEMRLVLIRQYRYSLDRWIWELPAGRIEPGEQAQDAAIRECEEEIGLTPGRLELVAELHPTPGFCDELMKFYRLTALGKPARGSTERPRDPDEQIEVRIFALDDVRAMMRAGEIVDLKTAFGLMLPALR